VCIEEEGKDMATKAFATDLTLNESEAVKILKTPRRSIKETDVFNDINLSHEEKIKHATNILNSRK
jgi:hypothetical protein